VSNVFLTGATGTIGSELVPRLLRDESTSVSLLIRASDEQELRTRHEQMLSYWRFGRDDPRAQRLRPMRGDVSLANFGLDARGLDIVGETTHVIHCAASVKLNMSPEQAHATAVVPTRTVLDLGRRLARAGSLRKIDLVSTVGVWGRTPGHMPERPLPEVRDFHNTYEAAKAEAERVVWAEGGDLPITVHRPSMVVGASTSGRVIHFQVFYHLCEFLSGVRTFGLMPPLGETTLDTVPVDWVADVICWSSRHTETAGQILHLCSGPDGAIPLPRLQEQVREAWRMRGRSLPRLRQVKSRVLERLATLLGVFVGAKGRRALRGLPSVLAYLAETQGFSNIETSRSLASAGLPVPSSEKYLGAVLAYYLDATGRGSVS
jgi:thioester reductase-like protein